VFSVVCCVDDASLAVSSCSVCVWCCVWGFGGVALVFVGEVVIVY